MPRAGEDLPGWTEFDDLAQIHDGDLVREVADDREVVRDEEIGELVVSLESLEQPEQFRLDRDIERRGWLVEHDQFWIRRQCPSDANALLLAAGKLVWIARHMLWTQSDPVEQLGDAIFWLLAPTRYCES